MEKVILVVRNHRNEKTTSRLAPGLAKKLTDMGKHCRIVDFPFQHSITRRVFQATLEKPRVEYMTDEEQKFYDELLYDNPDALVVDLHNSEYHSQPEHSGRLRLTHPLIDRHTGKNPFVAGMPGKQLVVIEIPAVYRPLPENLEKKKNELISHIKKRPWISIAEKFGEKITTLHILRGYAQMVDLKESERQGLLSEEMINALAEGIHNLSQSYSEERERVKQFLSSWKEKQ